MQLLSPFLARNLIMKVHLIKMNNMGYIQRKLFSDIELGDFSPPQLMGVINLSPESFYKGSFVGKEQIKEKVQSFLKEGATFIDIGARSTAPGVQPITTGEESQRINAALNIIGDFFPKKAVLSIDTQYGSIAEECIKFAQKHELRIIVNDVSAFHTDPNMIDVVTKYNVPVIIMASQSVPGDLLTIDEILSGLSQTITLLQSKNYDINKLIIDPGVGKWIPNKTYEYDLAILDSLDAFRSFGCPILVGISRKSFIGTVLDEKDPAKRMIGSIAATAIAVYNGAHIIRSHDVNLDIVQTIKIASAIRRKPVTLSKNNQICEILNPFRDTESAYHLLRQYDVTPAGSRIMKDKMLTKIILLKHVTAPQGLILKQELLARGGDVGLPRLVITTEWKKYEENFDVLLIGTIKQMNSLIQKLKGQQLKLNELALLLEETLQKEQETSQTYSKEYRGRS